MYSPSAVSVQTTARRRMDSRSESLPGHSALPAEFRELRLGRRFGSQSAAWDLNLRDALDLLAYPVWFDLTGTTRPASPEETAQVLLSEGILLRQENGLYAISNPGAILLAKRLPDFPGLSRKAFRVVQYEGNGRLQILQDQICETGYAGGLEGILRTIEEILPQRSAPDPHGVRQSAIPMPAVRETVVNALLHQDFTVTGLRPTAEVFSSRIEITNSGLPPGDVRRIICSPPVPRNEKLCTLAGRMGMCKSPETGWERIVRSCEDRHLPAPHVELYENSTRVTLFSGFPFRELSPRGRLWTCYLHACVRHLRGESLTAASLRERLDLRASSAGMISQVIQAAVAKGLLKPAAQAVPAGEVDRDEDREQEYVPFWA